MEQDLDLLTAMVFLTIGLLIATKLMDALSTLDHIRSIQHESNPLAGFLMRKFGITRTVWLVFAIVVCVVLSTAWVALSFGTIGKVAFIIWGSLASLMQAAAARANATGRHNTLTIQVLRLYNKMDQLARIFRRR